VEAHIAEALIALGIVIIGSIGTLVTLLTERIKRDLSTNTQLTRETKTAANGTLTTALEKLAAERNRVFALRMLLRERDDRIAFIEARHPDVMATLQQYKQRRSSRPNEADELAAEQHIQAAPWPDDPTGTDAA
jgi:chromosome segregation ATPase